MSDKVQVQDVLDGIYGKRKPESEKLREEIRELKQEIRELRQEVKDHQQQEVGVS